ncbi:MAG: ribosomal protection-like ABC-F family protein [Chloroflexota bacterium]
MILISLQSIEKVFGGTRILHDLSWSVAEKVRVGLIGPNGAGKSTILRILAGTEEIQAGEVVRKRGVRIAYLPQHVPTDERSPMTLARAGRPDLEALSTELAACETELGSEEVFTDPVRLERVLSRQEKLLDRFAALGGSGFEGEARSYLLDLGLSRRDLERPMAELSGGQRKIAALAICLSQRPDLLLLDEPETHLDLQRRERLEALIHDFSGAVVVVSHDRYLLDETVTEIAELDQEVITLWPGNYSAYVLARELALARQQEVYAAQQKEIERLEEAIARFKLWASMVPNERHIKQARVKQRQIDSMDKVERPVLERRKMALRLRSGVRGGQKIFEIHNGVVAFDGHRVLHDVELTVMRGERVGVVAPNGAGKSVLARVLIGEIELSAGSRWIGPSIQLGYFAQGHETLPAGGSPLDVVRGAQPLTENAAVSLLLRFLFLYDQVREPIASLSGGERSRLRLMLLMLSGANCLILDEPTNHLDIDSAEVLEAALEGYDGTVIVISHDRYFLDRMADRIVEIRDGRLLSFPGGYSDWSAQTSAHPQAIAQ